jgi:hypothetical protein
MVLGRKPLYGFRKNITFNNRIIAGNKALKLWDAMLCQGMAKMLLMLKKRRTPSHRARKRQDRTDGEKEVGNA